MGSVLNIKPIIALDNGEVVPIERVRTRRKALERLFELATDDRRARRLYVAATDNDEEAEMLAQRLRSVLTHTDVQTGNIGPTVGVYSGPNALGIAVLHGD
jgi:DegV family protein with EDD domain